MSYSRPDKYKFIIHPFLSYITPALFIFSVMRIFENVSENQILEGIHSYILIFCIPILLLFLNNVFVTRLINFRTIIREIVISLLVIYFVLSLFNKGTIIERIYPQSANLYPTLLASIIIFLIIRFQSLFKYREIVLTGCYGKEGEELIKQMHKMKQDSSSAYWDIKIYERILIAISIILIFLVIAISIFNIGIIKITTAVSIILYYYFVLLSFILLSNFKMEYEKYSDGIRLTDNIQNKRIIFSSIMILFIALTALIFTRSDAIIELPQYESENMQTSYEPELYNYNNVLSEYFIENSRTVNEIKNPKIFWVLERLQYFVLYIVLVAFLIFIFRPLFSKRFWHNMKSKNIFEYIYTRFKGFLETIKSLFIKKSTVLISNEAKKKIHVAKKKELSVEKKKELNKILKGFYKITKWADKKKITYTSNQTAREYLKEVLQLFPNSKSEIETILGIIEKSFFSPVIIDENSFIIYKENIKLLIKRNK